MKLPGRLFALAPLAILLVALVGGVAAMAPATAQEPGGGFFGSAPAPGTGDFRTADGDQEIGVLVVALDSAGCDVLSLAFYNAPQKQFDFHFPATPVISDLSAEDPVANGEVFFAACEMAATPTPSPRQPATSFGDGTYVVGTDIAPGRYRSTNLSSFCSWERLSGFSGDFDELIAIELPSGASALVDILPSDVGFSTSGCGTWSNDLSAVTSSPSAPFGDGTYLVGVDVAPGRYRSTNLSSFCSWERLSGFSGDFDELIAIELPSGASALVDILPSDVGFRTDGCGEWSLVE